MKVFKDDLNVYVNEAALKQLGIELPAAVKDNDKLILVQEDAQDGDKAE